jgi:hypothetical protein
MMTAAPAPRLLAETRVAAALTVCGAARPGSPWKLNPND